MRAASLIAAFITGTIFTSFLVVAWTGPTSPPPSGNVAAPINVGTTDQIKDGGLGVNALAVFGNAILSGASRYLNFGTIAGASGYGLRDSAGTMQFKNAGGSWTAIGSGSSSLGGSGTANYLPKFTTTTTLGNSQIFDNGMNVGIGTASPGQKLDVVGGGVRIQASAVPLHLVETDQAAVAGKYWRIPLDGTRLRFDADGDGDGNFSPYTTPMTLTAAGNVGIGTTNPGQKLTVAGTIETTSGGIKFPDGTTQTTAAGGTASGTVGGGCSGNGSGWGNATNCAAQFCTAAGLGSCPAGYTARRTGTSSGTACAGGTQDCSCGNNCSRLICDGPTYFPSYYADPSLCIKN
jgi:hypothetical protein